MGMYTGLRASVVIKPQWRGAIGLLHESRNTPKTSFSSGQDWEAVFAQYPDLPGLYDWVKVGRRDFIPFGALAYMPEDFSDAEDGESFSKYDADSGRWTFCCSLKNYEGEIRQFVEEVLSHIVDSVDYCESLYEEFPWYDNSDWRAWTTKWLS